jgi:hypothetical protein
MLHPARRDHPDECPPAAVPTQCPPAAGVTARPVMVGGGHKVPRTSGLDTHPEAARPGANDMNVRSLLIQRL